MIRIVPPTITRKPGQRDRRAVDTGFEFSNGVYSDPGYVGGLLWLARRSDGTLMIEIGRCDPGVVVFVNGQEIDVQDPNRKDA